MRGLYRFRDPNIGEVDVRAQDASGTLYHLSEAAYRSDGHAPPFEDLPWSIDPNFFVRRLTTKGPKVWPWL